MTNEINSGDDIIDSRDVIARIEELDSDMGALTGEEFSELVALHALAKQGEDYAPEWHSGVTLIHEDYFEEYAREYAEDIGAIDWEASWPLNHIDWEAAAEALQMDYTSVEFDGETYWIR